MIDRLAWVTAREARGRDKDEPLAMAALRRTGVPVEVLEWDDPGVDWARFDRAVLRSAWDYPERLTEFLRWLDNVAAVSEVVNPPATIRWNLDKRYLAELAEAGVPITPTVFVPPGMAATFPTGEFVVKPAVGAGSREAASYGPDQHDMAATHVTRLHARGQTVMLQPFLGSVGTEGEWPLIFFEGRFSHAANKRVALPRAGVIDEFFAAESNTGHVASEAQIEVAQAAVDAASARVGTPIYARVDLVRDDAGQFCVLELELIEPSLFLRYADPSRGGKSCGDTGSLSCCRNLGRCRMTRLPRTIHFEAQNLAGAHFKDVNLASANFRECNLAGAGMTGVVLIGADIDGAIDGLMVNGVEVAPLIEAELDRRHPERVELRPTDAGSARRAIEVVQRLWAPTMARAAGLSDEQLHASVGDEWSYLQTLRHLLFVVDAWFRRSVLDLEQPFSPAGLPAGFIAQAAEFGIDDTADPTLEDLTRIRADRWAEMQRFLDTVGDDALTEVGPSATGPGFPPPSRAPRWRACGSSSTRSGNTIGSPSATWIGCCRRRRRARCPSGSGQATRPGTAG